jgi:hypothetical protein
MHPAPLPTGALEHRGHRGDQPAVGVGDDQLHAGQAAVPQRAEELGPERLGLTVPDRVPEHLAPAVGGDPVATTTARETTRPSTRTLQYVASAKT